MADISVIKHSFKSNLKNFCGKISGSQKIDSNLSKLKLFKQKIDDYSDDSAEKNPPQRSLIKKRALELSYELKKNNPTLDAVFTLSDSTSGRNFTGKSQSSPYDYVIFDYDTEKNQIQCYPAQLYNFTPNFPSIKLRKISKTPGISIKNLENSMKNTKSANKYKNLWKRLNLAK